MGGVCGWCACCLLHMRTWSIVCCSGGKFFLIADGGMTALLALRTSPTARRIASSSCAVSASGSAARFSASRVVSSEPSSLARLMQICSEDCGCASPLLLGAAGGDAVTERADATSRVATARCRGDVTAKRARERRPALRVDERRP